MKIVVHVTEAELRGTPFKEYQSVLGNLIGEGHPHDDYDVILADRAQVLIDGSSRSADARDILKMAKEITRASCKDGYFG